MICPALLTWGGVGGLSDTICVHGGGKSTCNGGKVQLLATCNGFNLPGGKWWGKSTAV